MTRKDKINEDSYIQLVRMAREDLKSLTGINFGQFAERAKALGLGDDVIHLFRDIYNPVYPQTLGMPEKNFISMDAYMKLLQYDELRHSLKESMQARKEAKWAIRIATLSLIIQIILWAFDKNTGV